MLKRTLCIENPCHLKFNLEQLVISYAHIKGLEDRQDKTVPIEDIGVLVIEHPQITITHFLLDKLVANNIAVITCNANHHPSGMLLPLESHTLQSERFKAQINASEPLKKQLWQQTIKAKIKNQAAILQKWQVPAGYLNTAQQQVKSGDTDNAEAKAAAYYWSHLFPASWQFFRNREGPPPNNLLNYGYAIIRAAMARAIAGAGLLPTLGIFHRNRYNAYCLADDMMEPYRPFVDAIVRQIIHETSLVTTLTQPLKIQLLNVLTQDAIIDNQTSPLMIAMQKTAFSLSKCYTGELRKLSFPELQ
ncbi:type II CRISPR-associated endonuclease Cas1 [Hydrotalea sandarakina]|jgi:CRISPR-associated protein Cas1|uniref:CRISPR-associated endonuclease Cas1 n=1 Tax=Hydrotalea sandarakina TaxID=1004304 RepID=A0A2W7RY56_9BACT|nr:type II CRISPR-associated endonuclease Cas1 [Hydrotalea sandarakina]PZX65708.1 CRISPR-associated protein Cas1 [Hydrotalea sandarakina]